LDFKHLMPIVAHIAQTASTADPEAGATLPLSQLEHYEGYLFNGSYRVDFEALAPLMALPGLRTMCTPGGEIPRQAIVCLAQNIRGPCVINQGPSDIYGDTPDNVDWNFLDIPFEGAGEAEWTIEFRQEDEKEEECADCV
jgi:hypothetical protein